MARYRKRMLVALIYALLSSMALNLFLAAGKYLCEWDHWFVAIVVAAFR